MLKRTKLAKVANAEVSAAVNIPYSVHLSSDVIKTTTGDLVRIYKFKPTAVKTADEDDINSWWTLRHNALRSIKSPSIALWTHTVKRKLTKGKAAEKDGFAAKLSERFDNDVLDKDMYVTEFYLTIVYRPNVTGIKTVDFASHIFKKKSHDTAEVKAKYKRHLFDFDRICTDIIGRLNLYQPESLKCFTEKGITYSDALSFLAYLVDGRKRNVPVFPSEIRNYLSVARINFGKTAGSIQEPGRDEQVFGALGIFEYVAESNPLCLDEVLRYPAEMVISQSYCFISRADAKEALRRQQGHLVGVGDDGAGMIAALDGAIERLSEGQIGYGQHNLSIQVKADSLKKLGVSLSEISSEVLGHELVREELALEASFWSMLPGSFSYIPRNAPISTENFADFASFHGFPTGNEVGHWGPALAVLKTDSGTPYNFNLHVEDLGHTTFIGPSGSGKTTWMTFIAMMLEKYGDVEQIFFDKDYGAEPAILALGGVYNIIRLGRPTGFNPLHLPLTKVNKSFLINLFRQCVVVMGETFSNQDLTDLSKAIEHIYALPKESRLLSVLINFLPVRRDSTLKKTLEMWTGDKPYGWVFDNPTDSMDVDGRIFGYDMTELLSDPQAKGPVSNYIMFRHKEKLDGRKTAFYFDEGWSLLDDEYWAEEIEDLELTIRKSNGITLFATQMPQVVLESKAGLTVLNQAATNIYAGNPKADRDTYINGFKLSEREFEIVSKVLPGTRSYLIKQAGAANESTSNGESVVVNFDLSPVKDLIPVLSNKKSYIEHYRKIIEMHGSAPDVWVPRFLEKVNNI